MGVWDINGASADGSGNLTLTGALVAGTISEAVATEGVTVDGCLIKDGYAAGPPTASLFTSTIQTGTGSAQNIAHGLGAVPRMYWVEFADTTAGGPPIVAKGTPTTTNIVVTVTTGVTYYVHAIK